MSTVPTVALDSLTGWPPLADTAGDREPKIIVQKYGGSSVADPVRLRAVAARVAQTVSEGYRVVVVVSAMGKSTDELIALARSISAAPPRRELDMLMSSGERITMALLAMALHELHIDAISFTGSQSGILTNDRHSGARIIEVRPVRIQDELARDRVVIVAGFQGMSYKREVTTLGRGGSDTTAVALAAALQAERCEIYSDVDGVYSADPRIVADAHHLPEIGYREMQELADHGAKVLNAQAVEWAQRAGIVIHARKTTGSNRQTLVREPSPQPSPQAHTGRATAICATARILDLTTAHDSERLLQTLSAHSVPLRELHLQPDGHLQVALVTDDVPDWSETLAALRQAVPDLQLRDDQGTVSAIGPGLGLEPALLQQVLTQLKQAGLTPTQLSTSPLRLTVRLPCDQVQAATALLHQLLCAQGPR